MGIVEQERSSDPKFSLHRVNLVGITKDRMCESNCQLVRSLIVAKKVKCRRGSLRMKVVDLA